MNFRYLEIIVFEQGKARGDVVIFCVEVGRLTVMRSVRFQWLRLAVVGGISLLTECNLVLRHHLVSRRWNLELSPDSLISKVTITRI